LKISALGSGCGEDWIRCPCAYLIYIANLMTHYVCGFRRVLILFNIAVSFVGDM
jgi:hypothetical protein